MAREGQLGTCLSRVLRNQNAIIIPMIAGMHGMTGVADKYFCHRYWRGWVELKAADQRLTQAQIDFVRLVVERGDNAAAIMFVGDKWPCRMAVTVFKLFDGIVYQTTLLADAEELLKLMQWMQELPREGWSHVQWKSL
jgi:hypothetical protein